MCTGQALQRGWETLRTHQDGVVKLAADELALADALLGGGQGGLQRIHARLPEHVPCLDE